MIIWCLIFLRCGANQDEMGGLCLVKSSLRLFIKNAVDEDQDDTRGHVSDTAKYEYLLLIRYTCNLQYMNQEKYIQV